MKKIIAILIVIFLASAVGITACMHTDTPEQLVRKQIAMEQPGADSDTSAREQKSDNTREIYHSPVDFALLQKQNPDICAWIEIPDTCISYPVLKDEEAPDFYLNHDSMKKESISGALFIDEYNERDFSDNVTVIYGHHMSYGEFFGRLQSYYQDEESFRQNHEIRLYLPEEMRTYEVFAAVPYEKIHLLYNYDFTDMLEHYVFFDRVFQVRSLVAQRDEDNYPKFGEKVIILSTCLEGDNTQRYLVMGKEKKGE